MLRALCSNPHSAPGSGKLARGPQASKTGVEPFFPSPHTTLNLGVRPRITSRRFYHHQPVSAITDRSPPMPDNKNNMIDQGRTVSVFQSDRSPLMSGMIHRASSLTPYSGI